MGCVVWKKSRDRARVHFWRKVSTGSQTGAKGSKNLSEARQEFVRAQNNLNKRAVSAASKEGIVVGGGGQKARREKNGAPARGKTV